MKIQHPKETLVSSTQFHSTISWCACVTNMVRATLTSIKWVFPTRGMGKPTAPTNRKFAHPSQWEKFSPSRPHPTKPSSPTPKVKSPPLNVNFHFNFSPINDNGLVVKALDSQSRGPCSKPLGDFKVDSACHPSKIDK